MQLLIKLSVLLLAELSSLIGVIFKSDFKNLKWIIKQGTADQNGAFIVEVSLIYVDFITNLIDFVIVAFVMFMIVKAVNITKKKEAAAPASPKGPRQEELLSEIRDLLAEK